MTNPVERILAALREHGHKPRTSDAGWACRCPAHDDCNPSLSIDVGLDGRALVNCHAGCTADEVCGALGLTLADLFAHGPANRNGHPPKRGGAHVYRKALGASAKANPVDVDTPSEPKDMFPTARAAVAKLERRHGPKSAWWVYHNAGGEEVGVVVRWDVPPDQSDPTKSKASKRILPVSLTPGGWGCAGMPTPHPLYGLPALLATKPGDRVFVCEGEKAADAARAVGLVATTSPHGCNSAAKADWSPVAGRDVVILPDHDDAGEKYADDVTRLATAAGAKSVRVGRLVELWAGMPKGGDMADLVEHRGGADDSIRANTEAMADKVEPLGQPEEGPGETPSPKEKDEKGRQAEQVVRLAEELFRFGQTSKREPFAVPLTGPNVVALLGGSGGSGGSLRDILAAEFYRRFNRVMNSTAFADALAILRGQALNGPTENAHIRIGSHAGGVVLDLGTPNGSAVVIDRAGWRVVPRAPILFQRTALTGELPEPTRGANASTLLGLLNISEESWPVLLGWLVAAMIPDIPHPILLLGGQQGTGKTTAARFLCGLFDPSSAPTRSQPRDPEAWAISVASGWAAIIDNVSNIPHWWSDSLCKAVTGDGLVRRALYTNADVSVLSFKRVIVLTSIDAGALRGDLGERTLIIDLERIGSKQRRGERELEDAYTNARPAILGALLDLLASVLARRDSISLPNSPRMADFARVLAAMDDTVGSHSLQLYMSQGQRIAEEVLIDDPVGAAILAWTQQHGAWDGPAGRLLAEIKPEKAGRDWPATPRGLSANLKRLVSALEAHGLRVVAPKQSDKARKWLIEPTAQTAQPPSDSPRRENDGTVADSINSAPHSLAGPDEWGEL